MYLATFDSCGVFLLILFFVNMIDLSWFIIIDSFAIVTIRKHFRFSITVGGCAVIPGSKKGIVRGEAQITFEDGCAD